MRPFDPYGSSIGQRTSCSGARGRPHWPWGSPPIPEPLPAPLGPFRRRLRHGPAASHSGPPSRRPSCGAARASPALPRRPQRAAGDARRTTSTGEAGAGEIDTLVQPQPDWVPWRMIVVGRTRMTATLKVWPVELRVPASDEPRRRSQTSPLPRFRRGAAHQSGAEEPTEKVTRSVLATPAAVASPGPEGAGCCRKSPPGPRRFGAGLDPSYHAGPDGRAPPLCPAFTTRRAGYGLTGRR